MKFIIALMGIMKFPIIPIFIIALVYPCLLPHFICLRLVEDWQAYNFVILFYGCCIGGFVTQFSLQCAVFMGNVPSLCLMLQPVWLTRTFRHGIVISAGMLRVKGNFYFHGVESWIQAFKIPFIMNSFSFYYY